MRGRDRIDADFSREGHGGWRAQCTHGRPSRTQTRSDSRALKILEPLKRAVGNRLTDISGTPCRRVPYQLVKIE